MEKSIRDIFVAVLAREGGERAVRNFFDGDLWRGDMPDLYNRALAQVIEDQRFKELPALHRLSVLVDLRPVTRKLHRNAMRRELAYSDCYRTWVEARDAALCDVPRCVVNILDDELRRAAHRLMALERWPAPVIFSEPVQGLTNYAVVFRRASEHSHWYVGLVHGDMEEYTSGIYLRTNRLSPRAMRVRAVANFTYNGVCVISVLVRGKTQYRDDPLPAAMELVRDGEGWRASPWRQNVDPDEALLPHVGQRVRLGDVIFWAQPQVPRSWENWYTWDYMNCVEIPGAELVAKCFDDQRPIMVYVVRDRQEVYASHPDHYPVLVQGPGTDPWYLVAAPALGRTQYPAS